MTTSATSHGWAVSFASAQIQFATRAEAKRFIKVNKKEVADQRGGTFNAVIVRIAAYETGREVIH